MELSFSRGFSHGFLDGNNHKVLVRGDYAKKRGIFLGEVECGHAARESGCRPPSPVKPGDGLVFDGDDATGVPEQGGRVYEVIARRRPRRAGSSCGSAATRSTCARLHRGQRVWKTDDPELTARLRRSFEGPPARLVDLDLERPGGGRRAASRSRPARRPASRRRRRAESPLEPARTRGGRRALLREQLGRLGGTIYRLRDLEADDRRRADGPQERAQPASPRPGRPGSTRRRPTAPAAADRRRSPSCRRSWPRSAPSAIASDSADGRSTAAALGPLPTDRPDRGRRRRWASRRSTPTIRTSRNTPTPSPPPGEAGASIYLATPRIEKPAEANLFRYLASSGPTASSSATPGGCTSAPSRAIPFVADFSLNAANPLTVELLKTRGAGG